MLHIKNGIPTMRKTITAAVLTLALVLPVAASAAPVGKVNVNTATTAQLALLYRVGPKMADAIVAGRPYHSLGDLDRVKGWGEKTAKANAPYVSFARETTLKEKVKVLRDRVAVGTDSSNPRH